MFERGNEFWKQRSRHGAKPTFPPGAKGASKLLEACEDYFEWAVKNPLKEARLVSFEGDSTIEEVPKLQAFTILGLCIFIDISTEAWRKWRTQRQDLVDVIEWAESVIRHQKFNAAAAGLLNATIISRDLGLADRTEISGPGGGPVQSITTEMTAEEAADLYAQTREAR
jgi:hypothetical protein